MQWHLKELIGRYESKNPGVTLSYRHIQGKTGISTAAIHRIAANKASRVDLDTLNTLLNYFGDLLNEKLDIPDLLRYERDHP